MSKLFTKIIHQELSLRAFYADDVELWYMLSATDGSITDIGRYSGCESSLPSELGVAGWTLPIIDFMRVRCVKCRIADM